MHIHTHMYGMSPRIFTEELVIELTFELLTWKRLTHGLPLLFEHAL